jgi:HPt (histidine-containing phosphotransfer) domain-containing protein
MFFHMLEKFEDLSLIQCMKDCAKAVDEMNYDNLKHAAHSLKGSSGYVGASHLHYACYFI